MIDIAESAPYEMPDSAIWHRCNVADRLAVKKIAAEHSDADALVLAAGILSFDDWEEDDWDESFHKVT